MASSRPKVYSALVTPAIAFLCLATVVPIAAVIALSFGDFNIAFPEKTRFIRLYNYARILSDGRFINAALVTFILVVVPVVLQLLCGLALAIALKENLVGTRWMRASFLLPSIIPPAVGGIVWKLFLIPGVGGLSYPASLFGHNFEADLLGSKTSALISVIIVSIWFGVPIVALLLLSSLDSIPDEIYEAANLDGASWAQAQWHISIPLVIPAMGAVSVFQALEVLGIFPVIFVLTGGGPAGATEPLNFYAFLTAFTYLDLDYSAAILVAFTTTIVGVCFWSIRQISATRVGR
ncbi:MAG: sugar ABC transporter permease [Mesorhizobium sp.]|uniref:carbohydrate ABC transporter permease n=1 Tax=Mesorhizobium sp. TaxID=1871066 RepID=UPI000FE79877|nr:sugar ABC transporter permease [Mesorhizobium sp.]RWJ38514.1 MAG: sugar ABC transporter permease [Mesorhizobium sp.]RWJ79490.1 MAG: sugar ABC transporter permease [Mesorhizobium sp.]